jgi:hypothetical protein
LLQIGHGNVGRNVDIPIHMLLPRLFVCPSVDTNVFSVGFEVNVNVVFDDNFVASESIPLTVCR